ncbi:AfsR/SARP family transcriptional regulator [Herbidospora sp. NBRC 101105]|uniref:AfsR/SARP family transcriptional regulator n=1 Tax=Herbidospora sp. NBRC 101105 TaxID=3032195 RepID=UPI0024A38D93|nr:AfsR/SARP family transcriptional regulator [Herbidospora sp. NBRC 101105]GLX92275.1 ATPase AAA [Herbidospora sp. NBRC 101105]
MDVRLFGPLEVRDAGGRQVELGTPKQRAVLAMLAIEPGRVVSLDRLIDELWSGEAPSSATGTLQAYISQLRRALEPDRAPRTPPRVLLTREPGYLLAVAPGEVDLARFRALADDGRRVLAQGEHARALRVLDQALAVWRGGPLEEFAAYPFAQPVIAELADLRVSATEDRFEARLALGESGSCVPGLESLVNDHPYRERMWGLLVLALYRAGRQADALAALRQVRAVLDRDLGIEPGPELRRLEQAVFGQSADLDMPAAVTVAPAPPAPRVAGERLIARTEQLARIDERLSAVRRGRGGVLIVTGEAGVGKTRLAQAAAEEAAARGLAVGWGRCAEDTGAPAFWPWLQVLRDLGRDTARSLLTGDEALAGDPGAALFELHARVVDDLAGGPVPALVVLDDLHWADAASLRLLQFAAGELARRPVLVLVTLRPDPGDLLRDTLGSLSREIGADRVPLRPFSPAEVSAYLRRRDLDDPALAGRLHERTGGNPFYLGELLRLLDSEHRLGTAAEGVPDSVREVIGRRVARLPEATQEALRAVAVLGREAEVDVLERVTGTDAEQVMSQLEPAVGTGLLVESDDGYRFSHALVRDALYAGLPRLARARLHLRAALALEGLPSVEVSTLAHHFGLAARVGGAAKAVDHAIGAARQSAARHAYDEAAAFWARALAALGAGDPARRCELLIEHGQALRAVGDPERARVALVEAIGLAADLGDRAAVIRAVSVFGGATVWNWQPYGWVDERLVGVLDGLLREPLDVAERAAVLGVLGLELGYSPRRAEGEAMAAEAIELARRTGDDDLLVRTINGYLVIADLTAREAERTAVTDEMLAIPGLPARTEIVARVFRMSNLLRGGRLAEWEHELARCRHLLAEARRPELTAMVLNAESAMRVLRGEWDEAERLAAEFGGLLGATTMWGRDYPRLVTVFVSRRAQGRTAEILPELVAYAARPEMIPLRPAAILATLDVGDVDGARRMVAEWGTEIPDNWSTGFLTALWAEISCHLSTPDPGSLYARLRPYGERIVVNGTGTAALGSTHLPLARLARAMGDPALARRHAEAALALHERLGLAHWAAESRRVLTELGA